MTDLIFYKKVVSLDKEKHAKLKLNPAADLGFAAKTNSVPLVGAEFVEVAREFPIAFVKGSDDKFLPVALLGLRDSENLFVNADNRWDGRYLPAFIRRYPFAPADVGENEMVVCLDEEAECLTEGDGIPLFEGDKPGPVLQNALALLQDYQNQAARTQAFCQRLADFNVLMESNAQVKLADGADFRLSGIYVVDQNRFHVLDKDRVHELFASGELGLVYAHLMSLGNLGRLTDKLSVRLAATGVQGA